MKEIIRFIGFDVHKEFIAVATADEGRGGIKGCSDIANTPALVKKFANRMARDGHELCFVYEAGCFGFGMQRQLSKLGHTCIVAAPSLIPRKPGDRVKTDHRDAEKLVRALRAGDITACHVPDESDEAMRDITRAREDAVTALRVSRQRLNGFLLRHGKVYAGKSRWSKAHMNWILDIKMPHEAQHVVMEEYRRRVEHDVACIASLTKEIRRLAKAWRWSPVVDALQAFRGISLISAATIVAEMGDLRRFAHPKQLMAALGLVPSEHSSGGKRHQGPITKIGNGHVRKILVETAWNYRFPARVTRVIERRQRQLDKTVTDIAWHAEQRLCGRYQDLNIRGKNIKLVATAIARELCGFIWDVAQQVEPVTNK
ncbi:MAG: IS110 family transposase [Mariprofundus sp.]|nr:IS110 family transposase [Mariprofundus sp.]